MRRQSCTWSECKAAQYRGRVQAWHSLGVTAVQRLKVHHFYLLVRELPYSNIEDQKAR